MSVISATSVIAELQKYATDDQQDLIASLACKAGFWWRCICKYINVSPKGKCENCGAKYQKYVATEHEIVNNGQSRLVAAGCGVTFDYVRVDSLEKKEWVEVLYWTCDEWRGAENEAFEAILGIIKKIDAGERIEC